MVQLTRTLATLQSRIAEAEDLESDNVSTTPFPFDYAGATGPCWAGQILGTSELQVQYNDSSEPELATPSPSATSDYAARVTKELSTLAGSVCGSCTVNYPSHELLCRWGARCLTEETRGQIAKRPSPWSIERTTCRPWLPTPSMSPKRASRERGDHELTSCETAAARS